MRLTLTLASVANLCPRNALGAEPHGSHSERRAAHRLRPASDRRSRRQRESRYVEVFDSAGAASRTRALRLRSTIPGASTCWTTIPSWPGERATHLHGFAGPISAGRAHDRQNLNAQDLSAKLAARLTAGRPEGPSTKGRAGVTVRRPRGNRVAVLLRIGALRHCEHPSRPRNPIFPSSPVQPHPPQLMKTREMARIGGIL